jgi:AmmeMemoRadiSam system protein B
MSAHQLPHVRPPVFAGSFYPAEAAQLRREVEACLREAEVPADEPAPKALVLPHAGYIYSGPVAGFGYQLLARDRSRVRRVVLLGPSHRVGFDGLALSAAEWFATPLGLVPVDVRAATELLKLSLVQLIEPAHAHEHSLEVHLPFLQMTLADFQLVPIVVGEATPEEVDAVLEKLWGGMETCIIISSDLSHYHDYATARRLDAETAGRITRLQPVRPDQACGARPLNGLLHAAAQHRLHAHTLDLRNSGDTAGDRSRVVGYGAFALSGNA